MKDGKEYTAQAMCRMQREKTETRADSYYPDAGERSDSGQGWPEKRTGRVPVPVAGMPEEGSKKQSPGKGTENGDTGRDIRQTG